MKNNKLPHATIEADTGLTFYVSIIPDGVIVVSRRFPDTPDTEIELTASEARMLAAVLPHKAGRLQFGSQNTEIEVSNQGGMRVLSYRYRKEPEITSVMNIEAASRLAAVLGEMAPKLDELIDALHSEI